MAASRKQKCFLSFLSVCCLILGGAIAACGLLFQYHDDFDKDQINGMGSNGGYEYYYTQYWLGAPLIVLGIFILSFICCKAKPLLYFIICFSTFTLVLAITAIILEGPKWRRWLSKGLAIADKDPEDADGTCILPIYGVRDMSCDEIIYATVMQSILVLSSILSIAVSQFVVFVSMRCLGGSSQSSYDISKRPYDHGHAYNGNSNLNIMTEM